MTITFLDYSTLLNYSYKINNHSPASITLLRNEKWRIEKQLRYRLPVSFAVANYRASQNTNHCSVRACSFSLAPHLLLRPKVSKSSMFFVFLLICLWWTRRYHRLQITGPLSPESSAALSFTDWNRSISYPLGVKSENDGRPSRRLPFIRMT